MAGIASLHETSPTRSSRFCHQADITEAIISRQASFKLLFDVSSSNRHIVMPSKE